MPASVYGRRRRMFTPTVYVARALPLVVAGAWSSRAISVLPGALRAHENAPCSSGPIFFFSSKILEFQRQFQPNLTINLGCVPKCSNET